MNNTKPAYITLLLALLHGVAGISILVISSWFIDSFSHFFPKA